MGKKNRVEKTKEVSAAIVESSTGEKPQQQKRKRGRPRKTVEKREEIKEERAAELEGESKKTKTIQEEEEEEEKQEKEEVGQSAETQVGKLQPPRRSSRAKRKSKPRKST